MRRSDGGGSGAAVGSRVRLPPSLEAVKFSSLAFYHTKTRAWEKIAYILNGNVMIVKLQTISLKIPVGRSHIEKVDFEVMQDLLNHTHKKPLNPGALFNDVVFGGLS